MPTLSTNSNVESPLFFPFLWSISADSLLLSTMSFFFFFFCLHVARSEHYSATESARCREQTSTSSSTQLQCQKRAITHSQHLSLYALN